MYAEPINPPIPDPTPVREETAERGWLEAVPTIILVFADMEAYRSPIERDFMPWLDAGVALATIVYAAADYGLGSCIVNPHIRGENAADFDARFNAQGYLFCGGVALGYAAVTPECPEKKPIQELVTWLT